MNGHGYDTIFQKLLMIQFWSTNGVFPPWSHDQISGTWKPVHLYGHLQHSAVTTAIYYAFAGFEQKLPIGMNGFIL